MIYANVELTVEDRKTVADKNIVLYRGDRNVEIRFVIKGNRFTVLDSTYAQMIIRRPSATSVFSDPVPIQNDTVVFTISEDMIDELKEIGSYTFQVRLYDDSMNARATLPPCEGCLIINQPIATEGEALVNAAMINDSAVLAAAYSDIPESEIFDDNNAYNRTVWMDGDIITDVRMNKIEDALYYINEKGGGGTATAPYISTSLPETVMVGSGEDFELDLDFSSPNLGKGTLKVFINDVDSMNTKIDQGMSITSIPGSLFSKGTNMVVIYVLDRVGMMSNSLTFYVRYGGTEVTSTFDAYTSYDYGATVRYYFTPTALDTSLQLTFYMEIDGVTQSGVPCVSDVRSYYTFPTNLTVGNHYCRAWVTDGTTRSNVLTFNLIILDATSLVVATDTLNPTVEEGTQLVLDYKVYMKNNTSFITKTYVDNNLINTGTCTLETAYYRTTSLTAGTHTIKVEVFDVTETYSDFVTWTVTVTESTYTMLEPTTAGSTFMATAYNKSNVDENREVWIGSNQDNDDITASLSNFSFNSENGWIDDALVISGNSWVEIPIQPLANNAQYGFTLDIEFKTKAIGVEDAEVLTLWNETDNCGIKITTEQLILRSKSGNQCDLYFAEDEIVSAIFVIDRDEKTAKIYLNGVMCEAFALSDYEASGQKYLEDFTVNSNVFLGGYNKNGYCAIKNIRIYEVALATNEILNNFMSNEKDKAAQRELVEFQKGNNLPTLTIYCDFAGLGKDDKKPCNIVYNSPDVNLYGESFTLDGKHSMLQYQGTSSMQYPIKNYRINPRNADGKVKLDPFNNGVGESRFTLKADFMSSGHWQNTGLAKWVNDKLYNYNVNDESSMNARKWYDLQNGGSLKGTRESINGFPCRLILVNDGETPLNEGQQEPTPGNTKDMGIFNFNNDKDNVETLGFDTDIFPNCMSFEVTANSDTSAGAFVPFGADSIGVRYYTVWGDYLTYFLPIEFVFSNGEQFTISASKNFKFECYDENFDWKSTFNTYSSSYTLSKDTFASNIKYIMISCTSLLTELTINNHVYSLDYIGETDEVTLEVFKANVAELEYLQNSFELRYPDADDVGEDYGYLSINGDTSMGLKRVIDWVGNCTDEEFVAEFDQYFHRDYTLRYYLLVITLGMVDNLGKNMMLDTFDGQIWLPRFYDMDTICSYDNSGEIKFDVDIEMEQGYWNTSSSRLWTKIRDLMHDELVEKYNNMRQNGMSYESFMSYFYDKQIAQIPQTYYNKDYDVKYAPYADEYMGKAHGDGYEHLKRWLKRRLIFTDTLFDYAPSYTNDALTIRANTLDLMSLEIETYTPVYQHVSFYNGNMEKIKIDGKTSTVFEGTAQTATDQEVLIYGGSNIKAIRGIQSMNPNSMLIGNATRLTELDVSDCPILTVVNSNKANFSPHTYLNKLDISNCPQLGGTLNISNSPLLQEVNALGSVVDNILFPTSVRNLETLRVPKTVTSLTLNDAGLLYTLEMEEGNNLQSISLTNCNKLTETINFDLTQTPTVFLDNSFNGEEIYMSATTNLTLRNMPSLKRVIFTPNSEYSSFDINNVLNGANYKITTFNNPMMTDFITTAPHRLSYGNVEWVEVDADVNLLNGFTQGGYWTDDGVYMEEITTNYLYTIHLEKYMKELHIIADEGTHQTSNYIRTTWFNGDTFIGRELFENTTAVDMCVSIPDNCNKVIIILDSNVLTHCGNTSAFSYKDYGNITPNTAFTANTLDLADTQFQNVKFLCTTDVYNLKVPTTMKNFYCDSAMDIDTDVIEDASYEVIHEELIEPYTTNYEGEVLYTQEQYFENIPIQEIGIEPGYLPWTNSTYKIDPSDEWYVLTEPLKVVGGTVFTIPVGGVHRHSQYDENLNLIKYGGTDGTDTFTLDNNTRYIALNIRPECINDTCISFTGELSKTPNIIPSSANGSLIFNMYSNNTTQPTSTSPYMWDLTGLKLNDFHTYGMNNWVKASDGTVNILNVPNLYAENGTYWYDTFGRGLSYSDWRRIQPILFEGVSQLKITSDVNINIQYCADSVNWSGWYYSSVTSVTHENPMYIGLSFPYGDTKASYIDLDCDGTVYRLIIDEKFNSVSTYSEQAIRDKVVPFNSLAWDNVLISNPTSITMPQRMSGYSVRLVNADITPNEYPTMLYPKWIDTTLPITGKLDYTKYNGTSLAWAYAYTTGDVNINPLDSRSQGQITQDYNKLYGTDFVDIVDVWAYKDDDFSNKSTNEAITKAYIELTSDNYKTRVDEVLAYYPNCTDLYFFDDGVLNNLANWFDNCSYKGQIKHITFMEGYFENITNLYCSIRSVTNLLTVNNIPNHFTHLELTFTGCEKLTDVNIPTSCTSLYYTFQNCKSLNKQFDLSKLNLRDGKLGYAFDGCRALTYAPILPSNYTGSMICCFRNCTALTTAPTIPNGVTTMENTFQGCTSLTTGPTIPDSVTTMKYAFNGCSSLTQAPAIPSSVTTIENAFQACSSLTQAPTIPDSVTNMRYTFQGCSKLTQAPTIPSSVTTMENTFNGCTSLTTAPAIPDSVTNMAATFFGCTSLTTVPAIGNGVTSMASTFNGCTSLTTGPAIPDSVTNIQGCFQDCPIIKTVYIPLSNTTAYANAISTWGNATPSLEDIIWVGERSTDFVIYGGLNATNSKQVIPQADIQELVPEHLADLTTLGTTATLTLGETCGAYLTPDEVFSANAKGWTIDGASNDFTIINASDDVSGYTTDENVTSCFIELTSDNYKTRIDEVLAYYPNCTDLYFFDDGSVTNLDYMITTIVETHNQTYKNQIQKVIFVDGYFENLTSMKRTFNSMPSLIEVDLNGIGGKIQSFNYCFVQLTELITLQMDKLDLSELYDIGGMFHSSGKIDTQFNFSQSPISTYGLTSAFTGCSSLTQAPVLPNNIDNGSLSGTFYGCSSLTQAPVIPQGVTNMQNTFYGCTSLTQAPTIPTSVTNMQSTFNGCSSLTQAPTIPQGVTYMQATFANCTSLTTAPAIPSSVTLMNSIFSGCTSLTNLDVSNWNTSNVTNMEGMFTNSPVNPSILSQLDLSSVTNIANMFNNSQYKGDVTISNINAPNLTTMNGLFHLAIGITTVTLHNWNTPSLVTFSNPVSFYLAHSLTKLDVSGINGSTITSLNIFLQCSNLTDFYPPTNISCNFDITGVNTLSQDSVKRVVSNLATVEGYTLTLGETYLSYLTEDEIAQAVAKGWTLQ